MVARADAGDPLQRDLPRPVHGRPERPRPLAQARRRYEAGVTSSLEVVDAQTRTERARDNRVMALYQYNQARIDLATAMGAIHRILK